MRQGLTSSTCESHQSMTPNLGVLAYLGCLHAPWTLPHASLCSYDMSTLLSTLEHRYNTHVIIDAAGTLVATYRKVRPSARCM